MTTQFADQLNAQLKADFEPAIVEFGVDRTMIVTYPNRGDHFEVMTWEQFDDSGYVLLSRFPEMSFQEKFELNERVLQLGGGSKALACVIPWRNR